MSALAELRAACTRAEILLAEAARARQAHPEAAPRPEQLEAARLGLEEAAAACGALPPALARRVQQLRARFVLQARAEPSGALDGLYEEVRAAAAADPWGRAGMSGAFLDAPRSLVRWRGVALAACVLLAVGAIALSRAEVRFDEPAGPRPLQDPRDELLVRYEEDGEAEAAPAAAGAVPGRAALMRLAPSRAELERAGGRSGTSQAGTSQPDAVWRPRTRAAMGGRSDREGFFLFHVGGGAPTRVQIEEGALLDAAGKRLRVRVLPPEPAQDERESN